jgi:hypothetical protein
MPGTRIGAVGHPREEWVIGMPTLTDGMYKTIFFMGIFMLLMGCFSALFISSQIDPAAGDDIGSIVGASLDVVGDYPELALVGAVLALTGLIIGIIVVREMLPL